VTAINDVTLTLFFTRRVGLHDWDRVGNLTREVELYRHLANQLNQVNFITYGGRRDRTYASQLAPIRVHATPTRMPVMISKFVLQHSHQAALKHADILKTNQIPGAEIAIWAKKKYGSRLMVRCGYLYGQFMEEYTSNVWRIRRAYALEREAFTAADAGVVTSERDRQWVIDHYHLDSEKMHVIPNFVVTDVFKPMPETAKIYDLVCVAKASPQKNLNALFRALHHLQQQGLSLSLLLIGVAARDSVLRRMAQEFRLNVSFVERLENSELPGYLNRARAFILPSLYEGHPKTLLEAMSCGLPCIGTNVVGIRDDLKHQANGYLCATDSESLAEAIRTVLSDAHMAQALGQNARRYIIDNYSLAKVFNQELDLIRRLVH